MAAKISIPADCGNSPRKRFIKDIIVAIAEGDDAQLLKLITNEPEWDLVGKSTKTPMPFVKTLEKSALWNAKSTTINTIITHGTDASVDGMLITLKGSLLAFCHVISFGGAGGFKIKSVRSFLIAIG
ncbi:hypothetical protein WBG78_16545 [Chryseolinea sp. T2]|uniref:hypothetical protein n=1 Tax=Chryseolinea sp. T2 TaxID=3129255 RepID=UPI0030771D02